jgi:hypothetical protein
MYIPPNLNGVAYVILGGSSERIPVGEYRQTKGTKPRKADLYLRGPVPLAWLRRAAALTPSALVAALALAFQRGLAGTPEIKISAARFRDLGVERTAKDRGVAALVEAGLVEVKDGKPGRAKTVVLPW